jgi:hypothetical protein
MSPTCNRQNRRQCGDLRQPRLTSTSACDSARGRAARSATSGRHIAKGCLPAARFKRIGLPLRLGCANGQSAKAATNLL